MVGVKKLKILYGIVFGLPPIPLSQFIQDRSSSNYFSSNTILKNNTAGVAYSKFLTKNTVTNKKIDSFIVDISTTTLFNADQFWKYVTRLNCTSVNSYAYGLSVSNSFVQHLVTYLQVVSIQPNVVPAEAVETVNDNYIAMPSCRFIATKNTYYWCRKLPDAT